jgi:hypothetical protein
MEMKTVVADGYKKVREEWGEEFIPSVRYIEYMASTMNKDISAWDFTAFLTDRKKPYLDKAKISRIFAERAFAVPVSTGSFAFEPDVAEKIATATNARANKEIEQLKAALSTRRSYVEQTQATLNGHLANLRLAADKVDRFVEVRDRKHVLQLEKLMGEGFWEFLGMQDHVITFATKNDLVLAYQNKTAGIDTKVNLGKFKAKLSLNSFTPTIHSHDNNVGWVSRIHPHVSNGSLCFGELGIPLRKMIEKGEIDNVMRMTQTLLTSYNPASVFVTIEKLFVSRTLKDKGLLTASNGYMFTEIGRRIFGALDAVNTGDVEKFSLAQVLEHANALLHGKWLKPARGKLVECEDPQKDHRPWMNVNNFVLAGDGPLGPFYSSFLTQEELVAQGYLEAGAEYTLGLFDSGYVREYQLRDGTPCTQYGKKKS